MDKRKKLLVAMLMVITSGGVWAQEQIDHDMSKMDHSGMKMNHAGMAMDSEETSGDTTALRDPHAYAGGYSFSQFDMRHEEVNLQLGSLRVDRLERVSGDDDTAIAYDIQGWYGSGYDRAVIKAEGSVESGSVQEGSVELLWGRAIAPFWDTQLGVRRDHGADPGRNWLAVGIQGLAPYWFELDATAYVGDNGRSALGVEAEYDLLLTQRLVLQPRLEAMLYGKDDAERGLGSGLSELNSSMRLRYEIRREFAPYVGIEWQSLYGNTASYADETGKNDRDVRVIVGVSFWF